MKNFNLKICVSVIFVSLLWAAQPTSAARLSVLFSGSSSANSSFVRMFVTSTTYDGNLGGIAGADAKCQTRANAASLGGTWKAIISDSTTAAKSRTKRRLKPVFDLDGNLLWNPSVPLMVSNDSATQTGAPPWGSGAYLANAPEISEMGTAVSAPLMAWTGTNTLGQTYSTLHCSNWTSTSGSGGYGVPNAISTSWVLYSSVGCSNSYRLYCLEDE